jgi:catechol 2,3-dioxygenase-like lactoylglutathione lyase family enzyme
MINDIGHVAIQVPDLDAAVDHATKILGLRETKRTNGVSYLSHGASLPSQRAPHHSLQYVEGPALALDHIGLNVANEAALKTLRSHLEKADVHLLNETRLEEGVGAAIRFAGPDGHVFEAVAGMEELSKDAAFSSRVRTFGHVAIKTGETLDRTLGFLVDVLGFKVSDYIGAKTPEGYKPFLGFTRVTPVHHTIALLLGPPGLYHYAYEVASIQALADVSDALDRAGSRIIWGPGRHGAGDNLAVYHYDGSGTIVEHYCEMQMIVDDSWKPRQWDIADVRAVSTWGPPPEQSVFEQGLPLAARVTPV